RELLAAGADPMQRDWRGRSALDHAKKGTYPEHRIIERLLQRAVQQSRARRPPKPSATGVRGATAMTATRACYRWGCGMTTCG
ncbi:MAG: hypothetical protein RMM08_06155, partial [Armatimonadota bacterium]|nr:hypothetical protein [Armatimonadota bacterium]